ncbi:MAG: hypothetical protein IJD91_01225 [Clostridia bacterium]|nr:hypothetical protein [Clostridia bacterium]
MQNGYWVIRTYISGNVGEKIKYWVSGNKPVRSKRRVTSDVNKVEKNEKQSEKNLARILNTNFGAQGGVLVGLDYSDEAYKKLFGGCKDLQEVIECAKHQASLCLRRVQREAKKRGVEVKAAIVTADLDGETKESVRVHHHIVVNSEAAELFGEKWKHGKTADYEYLYNDQKDRTPLAHYLMSQISHIHGGKAYITTKNLERPKCIDRIAKNGSEISLPKNSALIYRSAHAAGLNQYLRYMILEDSQARSDERDEVACGDGVFFVSRRRNKNDPSPKEGAQKMDLSPNTEVN